MYKQVKAWVKQNKSPSLRLRYVTEDAYARGSDLNYYVIVDR